MMESISLQSLVTQKVNLLEFNLNDLIQFFLSLGEKSFRATQVFKWVHGRGLDSFAEMTDLSKTLREKLPDLCEMKAPQIVQEHAAKDETRKWLMQLEDGNKIETVFIPEKNRGTLCISSQVGCILNCSFCSTGKQGFNRNLTTSEIIGQVWQAKRRLLELKKLELMNAAASPSLYSLEITNVVLMGMGEPLLNFEAVVKALSIMRHDLAYAFPKRRVTLSTAGVVPKIDLLKNESDVALAVSLHAPNDVLRDILVPLNKKYPIAELLAACKRYVEGDKRRKITFEYVMLKDINDSPSLAKELAKILRDVPCKINLIPFNTFPGIEYQRSERETIEAFQAILVQAGYVVTIRKTRGMDIDAACGQLKGRITDRTHRHERWLAKHPNIQEGSRCLNIQVSV